MEKQLIQIGDIVREMTDEEIASLEEMRLQAQQVASE